MSNLISKLDELHLRARKNKWLWLFALFCRITLAAGFLPSGFVKIMGERFTSLSINHPMGNYLEALHYTGYYYTFIGVLQITAAILLLIPRTALLGAVIYFPIILNICILSFAVRFDGSLLSSPLANLYLLCWDYHKLKFILPFNQSPVQLPKFKELSNKFPFAFAGGIVATVVTTVLVVVNLYHIKPYNTLPECKKQCQNTDKPEACYNFCECIHTNGNTLNNCLDEYEAE